MSFEKRKQDKFLTQELASDLKLYHTNPEALEAHKKRMIDYLLQDTWKDYKTYKGTPQ